MYERDVAIGCIINFPVFMLKPSSYSQEFLNIVFCKVLCCIYMQVLFLGIFGNVTISSLYYGCF